MNKISNKQIKGIQPIDMNKIHSNLQIKRVYSQWKANLLHSLVYLSFLKELVTFFGAVNHFSSLSLKH